ncbi:MAG: hypothetical protein HC895_19395 [Leptolyngbyaceae cyanobacterium SM1_3_5]|nr:hypothetical protein [Leptolyngbyaceae cyanobacterium SM1_3_5]
MEASHRPESDRSNLWIYLSGFATFSTLIALLASPFLSKLLANQTLTIQPSQSQSLASVQVQPTAIGALRLDILAQLSQNRWVTYEIQIRDAQNQIVASAIEDAWTESGSEDGESWFESDLKSQLDLKTQQAESLTIAIHVLEHTDALGQAVAEPVSFNVSVVNGVSDHRFFWTGLVSTGALTLIAIRLRTKPF